MIGYSKAKSHRPTKDNHSSDDRTPLLLHLLWLPVAFFCNDQLALGQTKTSSSSSSSSRVIIIFFLTSSKNHLPSLLISLRPSVHPSVYPSVFDHLLIDLQIAPSYSVLIDEIEVFRHHILLYERVAGLPRVRVFRLH